MTVFSLVIIAVICLFFTNKRKLTLTEIIVFFTALSAAIEIMMSVGYFIKIGDFELGYSETLLIIDAIFCFFNMFSKTTQKKRTKIGMCFILSCVISFLLQVVVPYGGAIVSSSAGWDLYYFSGHSPGGITIAMQHIKEIIHVVCYVVIMMQCYELSPRYKTQLIDKVYKYLKPFIWFGIIELFFVKVLSAQNLFASIEKVFFGNSYILDGAIYSIGFSDRLRGLKSEPSMYGFALFIFLSLCVCLFKKYGKNEYKKYALVALALMVLSMSFTAIVCICGCIVYWLILQFKNGNKVKRILIVFSSILFVFLLLGLMNYFANHDFNSYYLKRIHMALINMNDLSITGWTGDYATYDGSTKIRMISIIETFKYFIQRPLFGLGLGSTYAHSTMATVFASIGVVGFYFWYRFTFNTSHYSGKIYKAASLIWCVCLIILDNGLFPFYGVENCVITYVLGEIFSKRSINYGQN